ncbi:hypothetical protein WJX73_007021 [Symbiochloris irregularis]|uniref:Attractin/MKLN-like beta-propeller domain-containing protein n=1 Tax=Symbiochloris irregularis TaxID=706552 RepID=A0AAW1P304_9CHLO
MNSFPCVQPIDSDPELLGSNPAFRNTSNSSFAHGRKRRAGGVLIPGLLGFVTLLSLALLGVAIWLGVEHHRQGDQIAAIQQSLGLRQFTTPEAQDYSLYSAGSNGGYLSTIPNVFLSTAAASPAGYNYEGSLFRGSGFWTAEPEIVTARADLGAAAVVDKIYLIGGKDSSNTILDAITAYDAVLDEDTNFTAMPQPRSRFAIATDNKTIYVVGGYQSSADETASKPQACMLAYNISGNSWSRGGCLSTARADACGAYLNGRLYVAGGIGQNGTVLASIEAYNPSNNSWSTVGRLPNAVSQAACSVLNSTLLAVAGGTFSNGTDSAQFLAFNPSSQNFTSLASLSSARFGLALIQLPSERLLAVGGGVHANGSQIGNHEVDEYDFTQDVWTVKAPISTQRFGFGSAYLDEGVYVVGGTIYCASITNDTTCNSGALASVEVYYDADHPSVYVHTRNPNQQIASVSNATQVLLLPSTQKVPGYTNLGSVTSGGGYWIDTPEMPASLSDISVVSYGNNVYIIGGITHEDTLCVDTLYSYSPELQLYTTLAPLPKPSCRGAATVLEGQIFVTGGFDSADETAVPVDTTYVYNISSNTWTTSRALIATARSDNCMAAINGKIYMTGGYSTNYTSTLDSTEVYDPNTNQWTPGSPLPTPRGDLFCDAVGDQFVVLGGFYDPTGQFLSDMQRTEVQALAVDTGIWSSLAPIPQARDDMAMAAMPGNRLLVMGGETNQGLTRDQIATHQTWEYLGDDNVWITKAPMTTSRFRFNGAFNGEAVYVFGGSSSSYCQSAGNGLEDCVDRPLNSGEAFFDSSDDSIFIYVQNATATGI